MPESAYRRTMSVGTADPNRGALSQLNMPPSQIATFALRLPRSAAISLSQSTLRYTLHFFAERKDPCGSRSQSP